MNQMSMPPGSDHPSFRDAARSSGRKEAAPGYDGYGGYGTSDDVNPSATSPLLVTWRTLMRRKWSILSLALLAAGIAWIVAAQQPNFYTAVATVQVDVPRPRLTSLDDAYGGGSPNRDFLQTQAEVMKSREVVDTVVARLGLTQVAGFDPGQDTRPPWQAWLIGHEPMLADWLPAAPGTPDSSAVAETVNARVRAGLSTEVVRGALLIRVRSVGPDPDQAARIANGVVRAYVDGEQRNRNQITEGTSDWIDRRARELKARVDVAERSLQTFRESESIVATRSGGESAGVGRELGEFSQRLVDARVKSAMAREALAELKRDEPNGYVNVPDVLRSPGVQAARQTESVAQKALAAVTQRYGPDHPRFAAANTELTEARSSLQREIKLIVDAVAKQYGAALALERTLESARTEAQGSVQTQSRKEVRLGSLERDAAAARQIYDGFLARFKQQTVSVDAQTPGPRIIEAAVRPGGPSGPNRMRPVQFAFIGALLLASLAVLVLASLDNTVRTSTDVETKLRQPFLASMPMLRWGQARKVSRAVVDDPRGVFAEAIRTAGTGIMLSAIDSPRKVVTITSSLPGEGKSTVSINLALALSKTQSTLLIEADMRKPSIAKALGLAADAKGLSELLLGDVTLDDCLLSVEGSDLKVLACGRIPPNPLEMLAAKRFKHLLEDLRERFELVLIDSPPLQFVSDALVVGRLSDGLVHVVKADDTKAPTVIASLKRVTAARIPIFGVILNMQDYRKAERYYGEYSGYGKYGYGKPYGDGPKATS